MSQTSPPAVPGSSPDPANVLDLTLLDLNRSVGLHLPEVLSRKIEGVCIGCPTDNLMVIALCDPSEVSFYDLIDIGTEHRYKAQFVAAQREHIKLAQEFIYKISDARAQETWKQWLETKKFDSDSVALTQGGRDSSTAAEVTGRTVEAADRIIKEGISVGASDIHIETFTDSVVIRYRQDGLLRIVEEIHDLEFGRALVKRLKVMANVDITQDRITQGGRIGLQIGGHGYDLRVSIVPVPEGESMVMRVLNKGAFSTTLEDLGFSADQMRRYRRFIARPHGLILTCGPTGAGKSTTLYASLKSIQRPDRKLLTVEDPIEYRMPGIIQVQVNRAPREAERQVTFASALREFLRHDPDVILVGEIRDEETARISIQAALTGHLVLSTIHTNDAVGIVNRLKDQNVKPYLVASTLIGGVAQRLVRRVCPSCREERSLSNEQAEFLCEHHSEITSHFVGRGCDQCRGTGYRGRVGLYELLSVSENLRELIEKEATAQELSRVARAEGMTTLLEDGLLKAGDGRTSLDEVIRVCMDEG